MQDRFLLNSKTCEDTIDRWVVMIAQGESISPEIEQYTSKSVLDLLINSVADRVQLFNHYINQFERTYEHAFPGIPTAHAIGGIGFYSSLKYADGSSNEYSGYADENRDNVARLVKEKNEALNHYKNEINKNKFKLINEFKLTDYYDDNIKITPMRYLQLGYSHYVPQPDSYQKKYATAQAQRKILPAIKTELCLQKNKIEQLEKEDQQRALKLLSLRLQQVEQKSILQPAVKTHPKLSLSNPSFSSKDLHDLDAKDREAGTTAIAIQAIEEYESLRDHSKSQIDALQKEQNKLKNDLEQEQKKYQLIIQSIEQKSNEFVVEKQKLQASIQASQERISELKTELSHLGLSNEKQKNENKQLTAENAQLLNEKGFLAHENKQLLLEKQQLLEKIGKMETDALSSLQLKSKSNVKQTIHPEDLLNTIQIYTQNASPALFSFHHGKDSAEKKAIDNLRNLGLARKKIHMDITFEEIKDALTHSNYSDKCSILENPLKFNSSSNKLDAIIRELGLLFLKTKMSVPLAIAR